MRCVCGAVGRLRQTECAAVQCMATNPAACQHRPLTQAVLVAARVQQTLVAETVVWKQGILVMPRIVHQVRCRS